MCVKKGVGFFFFQAEDGIRDIGVTGVQTCALPIFILIGVAAVVLLFVVVVALRPAAFRIVRSAVIAAPPEAVFEQVNDFQKWRAWSPDREERRVGKECRSRWSPHHLKTKTETILLC